MNYQSGVNGTFQNPTNQFQPATVAPLPQSLQVAQRGGYPDTTAMVEFIGGESLVNSNTQTSSWNANPYVQNSNSNSLQLHGMPVEPRANNPLLAPNIIENNNYNGINHQIPYPSLSQPNPVDQAMQGITTEHSSGQFITNQRFDQASLQAPVVNSQTTWDSRPLQTQAFPTMVPHAQAFPTMQPETQAFPTMLPLSQSSPTMRHQADYTSQNASGVYGSQSQNSIQHTMNTNSRSLQTQAFPTIVPHAQAFPTMQPETQTFPTMQPETQAFPTMLPLSQSSPTMLHQTDYTCQSTFGNFDLQSQNSIQHPMSPHLRLSETQAFPTMLPQSQTFPTMLPQQAQAFPTMLPQIEAFPTMLHQTETASQSTLGIFDLQSQNSIQHHVNPNFSFMPEPYPYLQHTSAPVLTNQNVHHHGYEPMLPAPATPSAVPQMYSNFGVQPSLFETGSSSFSLATPSVFNDQFIHNYSQTIMPNSYGISQATVPSNHGYQQAVPVMPLDITSALQVLRSDKNPPLQNDTLRELIIQSMNSTSSQGQGSQILSPPATGPSVGTPSENSRNPNIRRRQSMNSTSSQGQGSQILSPPATGPSVGTPSENSRNPNIRRRQSMNSTSSQGQGSQILSPPGIGPSVGAPSENFRETEVANLLRNPNIRRRQ